MNARDDQLLEIFQRADMPSDAIAALSRSGRFDEKSFDDSYLGFLDKQIAAKARGPEWDDLYTARRRNLADFAGVSLIDVSATSGTIHYWVKIDPKTETVVHWERIAEDGFSYLGNW